MEPEENRADRTQSASRSRFKLVLGILVALVPGICIVLILNLLNRGGWFSLLSGLSGMVLYSVFAFVQWIARQKLGRRTPPQNQNIEGAEARKAFLRQTWPWFLLYSLLSIGGAVGLFFLPDQQSPIFALISGALGLLLCISAFRLIMFIGIAILVLLFADRIERRPDTSLDERGIEVDETAH